MCSPSLFSPIRGKRGAKEDTERKKKKKKKGPKT